MALVHHTIGIGVRSRGAVWML